MADATGEPAEFNSDRGVFRAEYERELGQWLRRRLGWLCVTFAVFQVIGTASLIVTTGRALEEQRQRLQSGASQDGTQSANEPASLDSGHHDIPSAASATSTDGPRSQPIGRIVDRWWEETISPITVKPEADADHGKSESPVGPDKDPPAAGSPTDEAGGDVADDATGDDTGPVGTEGSDELSFILLIPWWGWVLINIPSLATVAWFGLRIRPSLFTRSELVGASSRMILILGFLTFGLETAMLIANPQATVTPLFSIFFWHFTASLFLPWNWRESLRPIVPLFVSWVLLRAGLAAGDGSWMAFLLTVGFAPLSFVPALAICYVRLRWHHHRFKSGFVGRRFLQMRREYIQARSVHESLFPKPTDAGWVRFDFGYRPAADIGGDFIHTWTDESERFHVVLIDVTGHGLASAMSVARIHGEIERLRDEYPEEGPARILQRLNRYFHRLLVRHNLFASAAMLTIDPFTGELRYASAGHPPVFIRSRGRVRELESTTFILGAVDDAGFGQEEVSVRLEEGDRIVMFTDGAYEARSPRGDRFGLDRLREILQRQSAPPSWPQYIMRLVETFESGMPEDDLLVAEIAFMHRRSMSSVTGDDLPVPAAASAGARN
jgi:phosphoserine phosphatase RsbU/P